MINLAKLSCEACIKCIAKTFDIALTQSAALIISSPASHPPSTHRNVFLIHCNFCIPLRLYVQWNGTETGRRAGDGWEERTVARTEREKRQRKRGNGNKRSGTTAIDERERGRERARERAGWESGATPAAAAWKRLRSVADVMARWWWCWWFTAGKKSVRRTYYYHTAQLQRNFFPTATASAGLLIEADLGGPRRLGGPVNDSAVRWDSPTSEGRGRPGARRRGSTQWWRGRGSSGGDACEGIGKKRCRAGRTDRM